MSKGAVPKACHGKWLAEGRAADPQSSPPAARIQQPDRLPQSPVPGTQQSPAGMGCALRCFCAPEVRSKNQVPLVGLVSQGQRCHRKHRMDGMQVGHTKTHHFLGIISVSSLSVAAGLVAPGVLPRDTSATLWAQRLLCTSLTPSTDVPECSGWEKHPWSSRRGLCVPHKYISIPSRMF